MPAATTYLEALLRRSSNDLYRLALLLSSTPGDAEASLLRAIRRLAGTPNDLRDEFDLIAGLVAALPPERRHTPMWPTSAAPADAPLMRGFARLPRPQRLALSLLTLYDATPEQIGQLLGAGIAEAAAHVRDGLAALAPLATQRPGQLPELLTLAAELPEVCRATRTALGLALAAPPTDPAVRGHLALCSDCRAIAHTWQEVRVSLGEALRRTLRSIEPPPTLARRLQAQLTADQQRPLLQRLPLNHPWVRRAAVPLAVLLAIAALVLPRPQSNTPTAAPSGAVPALPPPTLVTQALETLYLPPSGEGLWHGRWEIRWAFTDGSYAPLHAQLWRANDTAQHRIQLSHRQGGGPYEFELAGDSSSTYYAVTEKYAPSLYPLAFDQLRSGTQLELMPEQRRAMLQARLESGAWALAGDYLRQAQAASELRSWGRQPAADGRRLDVIGFLGSSPLLPPSGEASSNLPVTILLSIDPLSGRLYQIEELHGPAGGEQTHRMIWRFLGDEWLLAQDAKAALTLSSAWNGHATFVPQLSPVDPRLPLIEPERLRPIGELVGRALPLLPDQAPPGVTSAYLINPPTHTDTLSPAAVVFYIGPSRRLALQLNTDLRVPLDRLGAELVKFDQQRQAALQPGPGRQYQATLVIIGAVPQDPEGVLVLSFSAFGFSRGELLALLKGLGNQPLEGYLAQARLFNHTLADSAELEQVLVAAATPPNVPTGQARHTIERLSFRRTNAPDQLPDPYHRPRYDGYPAQMIRESWQRGGAIATIERDQQGTIYSHSYTGQNVSWHYNQASGTLSYPARQAIGYPQLDHGQRLALRLLGCPGSRLEQQANGTRLITQVEQNWTRSSCLLPGYSSMWLYQNTGGTLSNPSAWAPESPYLPGLEGSPLMVALELGPAGELLRYRVHAGANRNNTQAEAWERLRDETVPAAQVPADAPTHRPPDATFVLDPTLHTGAELSSNLTVSLADAQQLVKTPLFTIPSEAGSELILIDIARARGLDLERYSDNPFDRALDQRYALRFTYSISASEWLRVYQGEAIRFGGFLRSDIFWLDSQPRTMLLDGRSVSAWRVIAGDRSRWLLVELDGTLLAIEARTDTQIAAASNLRRQE